MRQSKGNVILFALVILVLIGGFLQMTEKAYAITQCGPVFCNCSGTPSTDYCSDVNNACGLGGGALVTCSYWCANCWI